MRRIVYSLKYREKVLELRTHLDEIFADARPPLPKAPEPVKEEPTAEEKAPAKEPVKAPEPAPK